MKRLLAVLLCLVMLFTLAPFSAFAADDESVDETGKLSELDDSDKENKSTEDCLDSLEQPTEDIGKEELVVTPILANAALPSSDGAVASVSINNGDPSYYADFAEAVSAAVSGSVVNDTIVPVTINLLNNVSISNRLQLRIKDNSSDSNKYKFTLNLGSFNLSYSGSNSGAFILGTAATINIIGSGIFDSGAKQLLSIASINNVVNISGVTLKTTNSSVFYCNSKTPKVNIYSGIIEANNFTSFGSSAVVNITGGTFSFDPTSYVDTTSYDVMKDTETNTWSVSEKKNVSVQVGDSTNYYNTITKAYAALSAGAVVKLLSDVTVTEQLKNSVAITFDLNGHAIKLNSTGTENKNKRIFAAYANLTVIDSSVSKSGVVDATDDTTHYIEFTNGTKVTFSISGGTFKTGSSSKNISSGSVVTGGTFNFNPSAYVDDENYTVAENPTGTWTVTPGAAAKVVSLTIGTEKTEYTSVEKAYEALPTSLEEGQTATIKLLGDVTVSENLTNNIPLTFDLNGNTITLKPNGSEYKNQRVFYPAANLTITDSSTDGAGCVDALTKGTAETHYIAYVKSNVTLTICGGHYKSACSTKNFSKGDGASVVLDTSKRSWFNNKLSNIDTVNSTPVTKISTYAACVSDAGHEDCPYTYTNTLATIVYNVNGGVSDGDYSIQKQTDLTYLEGYIVNHSLRVQQPVKLGKIFDHWNTKQDDSGDEYTSGDTINIQSKDIEVVEGVNTVTLYAQWRDPVESEYVASIGSTNYASVMEAFYAANQLEGNTEVKLLKNVSENVKVVSGNDITLDLAGFELRGSGTGSAITNNGTLIIKDSVGSGLVYGEAQSKGGGIENTGTLTLKSGTIDGKAPTAGGAVYINKGKFTMEGGTVRGSSSESAQCSGTSFLVAKTSDSKLFISGSDTKIDGTIVAEENSIVQISQGQFEYSPDSSMIASWSELSTDETKEHYKYSADYKQFVVSVTSRIKGTNGTIANVSGGGSYTHADSVTVTTSDVEGFTFLGWYTGYSKDNDEIGTLFSKDLIATYSNPTQDITLYAVYEPVSSEKFKLRVKSEGTFTVNGETQDPDDPIVIDAGSEVTLVYTGGDNNFRYWALIPDEGHSVGERILTTNPTYTFIMSGDISLCAGEKSTEPDTAMTIYKSYYGQVLAAGNSNTQKGYLGYEPGYPSRLGYKFIKWVFSDDTAIEATDDNIKAKIPSSNGFIYIEPLYEADSAEYNITVKYVNETLDQSVKDSDNVKLVNGKAKLKAPEIEDKKFLYWQDYVTLSILSYKTEYTVRACNETTIYAVYGDAELEADVCVNITNIVTDTVTVSEKQHVAITETFSLTDDCTLINTGFVYYPLLDRNGETPEEVPTCAEMRNRLVMGAEDTLTEYSKINGVKDGTFILNLYAPTKYYVNIYARAFVQYTKGEDTTIYVQYSDVYRSKEIAG